MRSQHYLEALHSTHLDTSDFILLAIGLLEAHKCDPIELEKIRRAYLQFNYSEVVQLIRDQSMLLNIPKLHYFNLSLCKKNDDPNQDKSRRYFETKLAISIWDEQVAMSFKSIGKFAEFISSANLDPKYQINGTVNNLIQAEHVLGLIRDFGEETKSLLDKTTELRTIPASISNSKDRGNIRIPKKDILYSCYPGILKASSPVDRKMLKEQLKPGKEYTINKYATYTNKTTDIFNIDYNKKNGYSSTRKEVPFVNSISGTTFTFVAALSLYINEHKQDPDIQDDIHHLLQGFLAFSCMRGYHSLAEMLDVFNDEAVKKIFSDNNINLNWKRVFSEKILKTSIVEAMQYAETINLNSLITSNISTIKHDHFFKHTIVENHLAFNTKLLLNKIDKLTLREHFSDLIEAIPVSSIREDIKENPDIIEIEILNLPRHPTIIVKFAKNYTLELTEGKGKLSVGSCDKSIFGINPDITQDLFKNFAHLVDRQQNPLAKRFQ